MESISKKVIIIGAGIGGLTLSAMLAKKGYEVHVLEKNSTVGGRARIFKEQGFLFDMGPSWYMMPDVFEHFFKLMDRKQSDYYTINRLSPSYRIFDSKNKTAHDFYSDLEKNKTIFETLEPGSGSVLEKFLASTKDQYEIAYNKFMFKNYDSFFDFINLEVMRVGATLPIFSSQKKIINKLFKNDLLQKVMQYQTVLLGTAPANTPGIYSLMNYVDLVQGEWYPSGGITMVPSTVEKIAREYGVTMHTDTSVKKIITEKGIATGVQLADGTIMNADIVVSNADTHFTDTVLLDAEYRTKSDKYWDSLKLAPSAFIMYLGIKGKLPTLSHHNLFFSKNWDQNFKEIFDDKVWCTDPSLYICCPSKTDSNVAPADHENLFVLVPIAPGLTYDESYIAEYRAKILDMISENAQIPDLHERIVYEKIFCVKDFVENYNAHKGTALGPAHTLNQTAFFRSNNVNPKVPNLYYVGAGTNPGIGMPICIISAELAYKRIVGIKSNSPLESI